MESDRRIAVVAMLALGSAACDGPTSSGMQVHETPNATRIAVRPPEAGKPADDFSGTVAPNSRESTAPARDADLRYRVGRALAGARGVHYSDIDIVARNGVVALYGTVDAPTERDRILQVASRVDGVKRVVNFMIVVRGS